MCIGLTLKGFDLMDVHTKSRKCTFEVSLLDLEAGFLSKNLSLSI